MQNFYKRQIEKIQLQLVAAHDAQDEKAVNRLNLELNNYKSQLKGDE